MIEMEQLPKELKDNQYYVELLDALIEENDLALKNRLQKADTYATFVNDQAGILMDRTIECIREKEISFLAASEIAVANWKERMFS